MLLRPLMSSIRLRTSESWRSRRALDDHVALARHFRTRAHPVRTVLEKCKRGNQHGDRDRQRDEQTRADLHTPLRERGRSIRQIQGVPPGSSLAAPWRV